MLALFPSLFSTAHGWAFEDLITSPKIFHMIAKKQTHIIKFLIFITFDQIKHDLAQDNSISSSETANTGTCGDMMVVIKINHNAIERERRKRVNEMYEFIRSLLPISSDQKKKLSISKTISRVLKYIPELQKEVETFRCKKDQLLSNSSTTDNTRKKHSGIRKQSAEDTIIKTKSSVVSSVSILGDKEVVIQLISSEDHMSKNKKINLLSKVLEYLEQEEDELVLINATTFQCFGEGMSLTTYHLQVRGDHKIEAEKLKEKLYAFQIR